MVSGQERNGKRFYKIGCLPENVLYTKPHLLKCHGGPVRDEATVDRIFAGDLDGLPNLSSRVGNILDVGVDVDVDDVLKVDAHGTLILSPM